MMILTTLIGLGVIAGLTEIVREVLRVKAFRASEALTARLEAELYAQCQAKLAVCDMSPVYGRDIEAALRQAEYLGFFGTPAAR